MDALTDIIWAAGFFDGEACFALNKPANSQYGKIHDSTRSPGISVAQKRRGPLDELVRIFGGQIYPMRIKGVRRAWQWSIAGPDAKTACEAVIPHLRLKQAEAQALVAYSETGNWRGRKLTDEVIARRFAIIGQHELARGVS
jgi:hypothetical protein